MWQSIGYVAGAPFRAAADVAGKRVLITGVSRNWTRSCFAAEGGAEVIGIVRTTPRSPPGRAPGGRSGNPADRRSRRRGAGVPCRNRNSCRLSLIAILSVGSAATGDRAILRELRETFQVNFFAGVGFPIWLCGGGSSQDPTPWQTAPARRMLAGPPQARCRRRGA